MHSMQSYHQTTLTPRRSCGAPAPAFTLIELLVVISIIALLLALLLPALARARFAAHSAACASNIHQIGMAMEHYADSNEEWYPRALPLVDPANHENSAEWQIPWPHELCPAIWQSCYPVMVAPHLGVRVSQPFDYFGLPQQFDEKQLSVFNCPGNNIPITDADLRKCNYPLDYGLNNRASQNRRHELLNTQEFLLADMTWGLAYVPGTGGPNSEPELDGWWIPFFIHPGDSASFLRNDQSSVKLGKQQFIDLYAEDPPDNDPL